jgi:hypothetical protein
MDCPLAPYSTTLAGIAGKRVTIAAVYNNDNGYSLTTEDIEDIGAMEQAEQAFDRLRASSTSRRG